MSARALRSIILSYLIRDLGTDTSELIFVGFFSCVCVLFKQKSLKMIENYGLGRVVITPEFTIIRTSSADNNMTILGSELAYWHLSWFIIVGFFSCVCPF